MRMAPATGRIPLSTLVAIAAASDAAATHQLTEISPIPLVMESISVPPANNNIALALPKTPPTKPRIKASAKSSAAMRTCWKPSRMRKKDRFSLDYPVK
jgi:hypothetical protein